MQSPLIPSALALMLSAAATAQSADKACLPSIQDSANPGQCLPASSIPVLGALLPLGLDFFVTPSGDVGLGTLSPSATLDVQGSVAVSGRSAFGNSSGFGPSTLSDWCMDFSQTVSDFSSATSWTPFRSQIVLDPPIDQVGPDAAYVYSHDLVVETVSGSEKQIEYVQGPYVLALHRGVGALQLLVGAFLGSENNHGQVKFQAGTYITSVGDWESTTEENSAAEFQSGHYGTTGWLENNYSLYVYTPYNDAPVNNHYGIYLEDQDVGEQDSYSMYSKGGTNYFAGAVGIGTDKPTAKLEVVGDFAASGTKSFVQAHPQDPSKEIHFVCLEGNEAGTYFRGRSTLQDGTAIIPVPEDFALVTEAEGLTVQLTARGPGADLWIAETGLNHVVIRGAKDVEFDYLVNGVRRGYAGFETIRERASQVSNAQARGVRSPLREAAREQLTRRQRKR